MSAHYVVRCADCDVEGPSVRRTGFVAFLVAVNNRRDPPALLKREDAESTWAMFLDAHEWHDLRLVRR